MKRLTIIFSSVGAAGRFRRLVFRLALTQHVAVSRYGKCTVEVDALCHEARLIRAAKLDGAESILIVDRERQPA